MIPGPIYELEKKMGHQGKFFIAKGKSDSFFAEIMKESAKKPGVGRYEIAIKPKILGNYKLN